MTWEIWLATAEAVVGGGLAAWAVRPASWGSALERADGTQHDMRLVADAAEMREAESTAIETWAVSTERAVFTKRSGRVNAAVVGSLLVLACGVTVATRFPAERAYGVEIGVVGLLMLAASCVPITAARFAFRERQKAVAARRVDVAIADLANHTGLTLPKLFTLNRRQLDQYQELTRRQQRSAFTLTQVTSVVAFAALIAGVVLTFAATSTADKFLSGGLAALGSALSAFLASTFFAAHKAANDQLNRYYLEPQRTGRLLAAERLTTLQPALDSGTLTTILGAIMSWEMPSDSGSPASPEPPTGSAPPPPSGPSGPAGAAGPAGMTAFPSTTRAGAPTRGATAPKG